jgi:hypothetical protein
MDIVFNKVRPGYKLVRINLEWNVQALNLQTTNEHRKFVASSSFFSSQEMPDSKWKLHLYNLSGQILIQVLHYNSTGYTYEDIVEPVLVKLSCLYHSNFLKSRSWNPIVVKWMVVTHFVVRFFPM